MAGGGEMRRASMRHGSDTETFLASSAHSRLEVAWHLLALGLRVGETLALRWSDVDVGGTAIHVTKAVPDTPYSALALPDPIQRERVIDAAPIVDVLGRHHRRQEAARSEWGPTYRDEGLVACRVDGCALHPRELNRAFTQAADDAGLPHLRISNLRRHRMLAVAGPLAS